MATTVLSQSTRNIFAVDVFEGLMRSGQKELPSKYLYDEIGSTLFEVISVLPEYGLTRADERLMRRHATDMVERIPGQTLVAELGSGSGKKTRWILEALARRQQVTYCPIEISHTALARCENELGQIERVSIVGYERPYLDGLLAAASRRRDGERLLVLFLGSTIGNFDRDAAERFLMEIRRILKPGDALLLGTDLVKPLPQMLAAYDDSIGVTAAFNLNLLARMNRELGSNFNLRAFRHLVRYDQTERRVEMHLQSVTNQVVNITPGGFKVSFVEGETIWTESSHKYQPDEIPAIAGRTGFRCTSQWFDVEWLFAENLLIAE